MKLHIATAPSIAFAAAPNAQRLNSAHIAPSDYVRFGSTVQLAKITAAEITAIKANPIKGMVNAIHEFGHAIMCIATGNKASKITAVKDSKQFLQNAALHMTIETPKTKDSASAMKWFFGEIYSVIAGPLAQDRVSKQKIELFLKGKLSPQKLFLENGGASGIEAIYKGGDYSHLRDLEDKIKDQYTHKKASLGTKIQKFFKRTASRIRAFFNPQKEHALMVQWIKDTHELMKNIPEEGLFRLAKTLEQHGTIEGHETIERLVKEALGNHYDTLQKQFNTLVAS